jgi:hypothetical protein
MFGKYRSGHLGHNAVAVYDSIVKILSELTDLTQILVLEGLKGM